MTVTGLPVQQTMSQWMYDSSVQVAEYVASCPLGQILFRYIDRLLWTIETSVQWFVEHNSSPSKKTSMNTELVRPLPWVLFLPFLLWLRLVKICVIIIASLRGKEPLRPLQVVQFIQVRRRRLRAIKYMGMKNYTNWQESQRNLADVQCIFMRLFCNFLGFVGLWRVCHTTEEQHATSTLEDSKSSVDNEDLIEKINRLCQEFESDDDPDYKPPVEEETDESVSSGADEDEAMNIENSATEIPVDSKNLLDIEEVNENLEDSSSTLSLESAETHSETTSQTYYSPQGSIGTSPEPESCSSNTIIPADQKPPLSNTSNSLPSKNSAQSDSSTTIDSSPTQSAPSVPLKPNPSEYVSNVNDEDYH